MYIYIRLIYVDIAHVYISMYYILEAIMQPQLRNFRTCGARVSAKDNSSIVFHTA